MKSTIIDVCLDEPIGVVNPNLYGHFSEHLGECIYGGIWVGEDSSISNTHGMRNDVIEALKSISIPNLRWPGGCFADDYHWRDGIGERTKRPKRINKWWDDIENNHFGTHEFLELCDLLECEPYICGNVGSGTVKEMKEWLEYLNCKNDTTLARERGSNGHPDGYDIHFWGVGNENWGCGGHMSPSYYANLYKQYATYCSSYSEEPLYKIACGANRYDYNWTEKFFNTISGKPDKCTSGLKMIQGYAFHYYCGSAGEDVTFNDFQWYSLLMNAIIMEEIIQEHRKIMDRYDPSRNIDLICDEWGTWHPPKEGKRERWLWQQNTIRDAMVAAITLDIFNNNCNMIAMANIAQVVNVLQSVLLTQGEKMIKTPTYHVYDLYQVHQSGSACKMNIDADLIGPLQLEMVRGSATKKDHELYMSLTNLDTVSPSKITINWEGENQMTPVLKSWKTIKGENIQDHNTFESPDNVKPMMKDKSAELILDPASINLLSFSI